MPLHQWNLPWLVHNSQRAFPIANDGTRKDNTETFTIPDDFILELDIPIHAGLNVDPARFFIKHIGAYASGYSIIVGYQPAAGGAVDVATALIARDTHERNDSYALGGVNDFDDSVGKLVIGRLDSIDNQPSGFFTFSLGSTRLEPDAVRPIIRGVSSLTVVSANQVSTKFYGDVELVAGENIQLLPLLVGGVQQIRISAINGEGLNEECICEGDTDAICVKRVNGIPPTPSGDFTIVGDDCLDVSGITNGIQLEDKCSKPCCGCAELEAVTRDLESFGSQAVTLSNFLSRLESSVSQFDAIVLGSKLSDQGCLTCEE